MCTSSLASSRKYACEYHVASTQSCLKSNNLFFMGGVEKKTKHRCTRYFYLDLPTIDVSLHSFRCCGGFYDVMYKITRPWVEGGFDCVKHPLLSKPWKNLVCENIGRLPILNFFYPKHSVYPRFNFLVTYHPKKQEHPLTLMLYSQTMKLRAVFTVFGFNPERRSLLEQKPHHLAMTEIPTSSIAAMFGYSRRYQRAAFIRFSFFKHLRRYILTLDQFNLNLSILGVLRQFKLFFKLINTPLNQAFKHPLQPGHVLDFSHTLPYNKKPESTREELHLHIKNLVLGNILASDADAVEFSEGGAEYEQMNSAIEELVRFFWALLSKKFNDKKKKEMLLHRYRLHWQRVVFFKTSAHSLNKKKRARSIKKRRTKRLVKKTKYRFWTL